MTPFDVYEAEDGNQALILADQHQPDIVILDIEMPGISGIELANYLPKKSIIIFAIAYTEHAIDAFEINAVDYIAGAGNYAEIHRSSIVRRSCVIELRPNDKGDYSVILKNGDVLTLSRRNRTKLDELTN